MPSQVSLRPTTAHDLPTLFQIQQDPDSNQMAGTKPYTQAAYSAVWDRILSTPPIEARVIVEGDPATGAIVGSINCFQRDGMDHIGYWIDKPHWGRGIATRALSLMISEIPRRPIHATAARSNAASIHILQRCGFRLTGYHQGEETDRYIAREVATFILE
jgi:RimJ/RimL family protein N-acetyltransferase